MGASSSKAAGRAAGAARHRYPQTARLNPTTTLSTPAAPKSTVPPGPQANSSKNESVEEDGTDRDFARSLRSLGAVNPQPLYSHTSTFDPSREQQEQASSSDMSRRPVFFSSDLNPAIQVIDARRHLELAAEKELGQMGRKGFYGKEFLDVVLIRQALMLRDDKGLDDAEIEKKLELKSGVTARLGRKGIVGDVAMGDEVPPIEQLQY